MILAEAIRYYAGIGMPVSSVEKIGPYTRREWTIALLTVSTYLVCEYVFKFFFPFTEINPGYAATIAAVFFGGFKMLPAIFIGAVSSELALGTFGAFSAVSIGAVILESALGGYLLRIFSVDPIFRHDRDAFRLLTILSITALLKPVFSAGGALLLHRQYSFETWLYEYVAMLFSLFIFTPFILRWSAKLRFRRTTIEYLEIAIIFIVLAMLSSIIFIEDQRTLFGVPMVYALLIPLVFIALRLRPRFVTLALVTTAVFALINSGGVAEPDVAERAFRNEVLLVIFTVITFIITALEEHRRANANQMHSQVEMLKNAVTRITSESRAKNDFIAILAHELRNPLTPVVSGIEILKLRGQDEENKSVLHSMEESLRTVRSLLNDLLDVSRVSEGKIALKKKPTDLVPILDNAITSTRHHRVDRHQNLAFKEPRRRMLVYGDSVRIEQIFSNLLTNASKYSDEGDTITIRVRAEGKFAEVEVIDEGVGLEKNALETIFEPFKQVERNERSNDGLGIGLSLVRDFANMHGGKVWAESEGRGRGSRFIVQLPLYIEK